MKEQLKGRILLLMDSVKLAVRLSSVSSTDLNQLRHSS